MVLTVPGLVIVMTPAHMQLQIETLSSAGMLPMSTVTAPGTHGVGVTGTQGIGVSAPSAAAVAAITAGFATELHIPKGMMLTNGMWSMMLAAGGPSASTRFFGRTTRLEGATPNVHFNIAPIETWFGICFSAIRRTG